MLRNITVFIIFYQTNTAMLSIKYLFQKDIELYMPINNLYF